MRAITVCELVGMEIRRGLQARFTVMVGTGWRCQGHQGIEVKERRSKLLALWVDLGVAPFQAGGITLQIAPGQGHNFLTQLLTGEMHGVPGHNRTTAAKGAYTVRHQVRTAMQYTDPLDG